MGCDWRKGQTDLTENEKDLIRSERTKGTSYNKIGKMIGPCRMTVQRYCKEIGIAVVISEKNMAIAKEKGKRYEKELSICKWCGRKYKRRSDARTDTCSKLCARKWINNKRCKICGEKIIGKGYHKHYCSRDCFDMSKIGICIDCGESFKRQKISLIRCNKCSYEYWLQRGRDNYYKNAEESNKKKRDEYIPIPRDYERICPECGKIYYTTQFNNSKKYCSLRCSGKVCRRRRRTRLKKGFVEDIYFKDIWKRDKGKCQICGKRVHKKWNMNDSLLATLDHIIALANGGKHEYSNIQLACMLCNSKKSASKSWLQLELYDLTG